MAVVLVPLAALCLLVSPHSLQTSLTYFAQAANPSEPRPSGSGVSPLETLFAEGRDHLTAGRLEQAAARFREALAIRSDFPEALFGLGVASSQLGKLDEAQKALRRYVTLRPSAADGHSALALVLLAGGKRALAKTEFERALRLEPHDLDAAKALAHIEVVDYHGARAVALLEPFAASADFDDEARLVLASGYAETADHKAAAALLSPLLERRTTTPARGLRSRGRLRPARRRLSVRRAHLHSRPAPVSELR